MTVTDKDPGYVIREAYDDDVDAFRTKIVDTNMAIELDANDGDSILVVQGLEPRVPYDTIEYSYPDAVTRIRLYKNSGALVGTLTEVYTDTTHTRLVSQTRS